MPAAWHPVESSERHQVLDLVRGVALFGVLLVNLLDFFRVSLFSPHTGPLDGFVSTFIEFKAFDLFSISFGIGVAVQVERAWKRGANAPSFLVRRFLVLLGFGVLHMTLVSNVDILCLYAICGLALLPFLSAPSWLLVAAAVVAVVSQPYLPGLPLPSAPEIHAHAAEAERVYSHSGFNSLGAYRWRETVEYILPLLVGVAVKTYGLMLGGMAVWRAGLIRDRDRYRREFWIGCAVALAAWAVTREHIPLAIAYGAALLAWRPSEHAKQWTAFFAAAGRMAFTNYLTQSMLFALLFYGFGQMGRWSSAPVAAFGVAVYLVQLGLSRWWLTRHRFGPFEWVWRSLTYGRRV